jgi:hypothetical protein
MQVMKRRKLFRKLSLSFIYKKILHFLIFNELIFVFMFFVQKNKIILFKKILK